MQIDLSATTSPEIAKAMVTARVSAGSPAMDMVLTLLVVTDDERVGGDLQTAATLSREHPARIIGIVLGQGRGDARLDASVRVGENAAGESILLRMRGPLSKHAETVVLPLLLPDSPVVIWWPQRGPHHPSADPLGALGCRRLTDAESSSSPVRTLKATARNYQPGDTDLTWTRATPWRALLAAAVDQLDGTVTGGSLRSGSQNPVADLIQAWLESRLEVGLTRRRSDEHRIQEIVLETTAGDIVIERVDGGACRFRVPGSVSREVPMRTRTVAELLAEDLRRLDADEVYARTIAHLLED